MGGSQEDRSRKAAYSRSGAEGAKTVTRGSAEDQSRSAKKAAKAGKVTRGGA